MRLLRLKVRNIASLKGESEVDFAAIQNHSPLFAITGETGSGKSSILNSIGLALYGQIYKKNVNQLDVVTLGEKDGQIDLIFQVKEKYFLAQWRAKVRKQNGELYSTPQTPTRELYQLEKPDFNSSKNITLVKIEELLNLDFDQFCKCIILNQGEFAKFLSSSFTDRKEILEKLYPGEMLENMSRELRAELDILKKEKSDLEIELATLKADTYSGEDLLAQKKQFETTLKNNDTVHQILEKLDYHFTSLYSCHTKHQENQLRLAQVKADLAQETSKFNLVLKDGQKINESYLESQKAYDHQVPVLQALLKTEESLRHWVKQADDNKKKRTHLETELKELRSKIEKSESQEKDSAQELTKLASQIKLPLAKIIAVRPILNEFFDLAADNEVLAEELKGKKEKLKSLEDQCQNLKHSAIEIEKRISAYPNDLKSKEAELEKERKALHSKIELKQRADIRSQEVSTRISGLKNELIELKEKISHCKHLEDQTRFELAPLETTLKLEEVLAATQLCLEHVEKENADSCPVCQSEVHQDKWAILKAQIKRNDMSVIKNQIEEKTRLLLKHSEENKIYLSKSTDTSETIKLLEAELLSLKPVKEEKLRTPEEFEAELSTLKKMIWELDALQKDLNKANLELTKIREQYALVRGDIAAKESSFETKSKRYQELLLKLKDLISNAPTREELQNLKSEARLAQLYLEAETHLSRITQEKKHFTDNETSITTALQELNSELTGLQNNIQKSESELLEKLNGEKAADVIGRLNADLKSKKEAWESHQTLQKNHERALSEFQSKIYGLNELINSYDLQFANEIHVVKEIGHENVPTDKSDLVQLFGKLSGLTLTLSSPGELFIPLQDFIKSERAFFKEACNESRGQLASVMARQTDWEKKQDKILILQMKARDIEEKLERKLHLDAVLGKDELRTFVLSLVEENLIEQTNDELQKLCQGRYEIVHQSRRMKMTPEFYILDKFREGGLRKVSTLSGGETFMVSLAMALGLAELTRGQAEIDSLFIDEGFGTLDQESLEDVLDMLQQIQTRGLMVGIISHIKALTNSLPVNVLLSKRQDGTSSVSVVLN